MKLKLPFMVALWVFLGSFWGIIIRVLGATLIDKMDDFVMGVLLNLLYPVIVCILAFITSCFFISKKVPHRTLYKKLFLFEILIGIFCALPNILILIGDTFALMGGIFIGAILGGILLPFLLLKKS